MNKRSDETINVVWLKKDLRLSDHAPLYHAVNSGKVIVFYCLEPSYLDCSDTSDIHLWWIISSLKELNNRLISLGSKLHFYNDEVLNVLKSFHLQFNFKLFAHQETGNFWSYQREKEIINWCKANNVEFSEFQQFGVIRKLDSRDNWSHKRDLIFNEPLISKISSIKSLNLESHKIPEPKNFLKPNRLPDLIPGEKAAKIIFNSFLEERSSKYLSSISKPFESYGYSSRLSPYITWGNISIKEIFFSVDQKIEELKLIPNSTNSQRNLTAFKSRLYWHCHFIQKLESDTSIEFTDFLPGIRDIRKPFENNLLLEKWQNAKTGYPLVDACMISLKSTGWINFRMRAMLVSFASYHLLQDWTKFAHFLARNFIDYEPGIHYSQLQMQSGTTGINAIRIYDPVKQSIDHDSKGEFIKRWIPSLRKVPEKFIHTPWLMNEDEQQEYNCIIDKDYPSPIVVHKEAVSKARELIYNTRKRDELKPFIKNVFLKHGSRRKKTKSTKPSSNISKSRRAKNSNQLKFNF